MGVWKDGGKNVFFISHSFQISRVFCKGLLVSTYNLIISDNLGSLQGKGLY